MTVIHAREDWDPGATVKVAVTPENMDVIFREKQEGVEETKALADILKLDELGVPKDFEADMKVALETMVRYAQLCEISTRVMYHVVYAQEHRDRQQEEKAFKAIEDLYQIADLIKEEQKGTHYPYYLYARLQPLRIRIFADSAARQLRE